MSHHAIHCFASIVSSLSVFLRRSALIAFLLALIGIWSCVHEDRDGFLVLDQPPLYQVQTGPQENPNPSVLSYLTGDDEHPCQIATVISSIDSSDISAGISPPAPATQIHRVRFIGGNAFAPRTPQSNVRLVGEPLPPEVVDQMNQLGKDIADYEHQKETLEKELRENRDAKTGKRLDRDEFKQKEKELDNVKNKLKSAEQNKQFVSDDARKVAEDAYKARKAQYDLPEQIRQLRAKGDPASLQQADMKERQLQALNQFYGPIASVPIIPPGQSGFAMLSAPGSTAMQGSESSMKGHMNFVATEQIKTPTDAQVQLESVAHVEEEDSNQTATMYAHFGYDPSKGIGINPNWAIGPTWTNADAKSPFVAPIDGKGDFTVPGLNALSKPCTMLHVAYEYNHVSTALNRNQLGGDVNVTMNTNPSWTAAFKSDVDIKAVKDSYMKEGTINGVPYNWTTWRTPFSEAPVIANGQISDGGYNQLSWEPPFKNVRVYGELNPGALTKPMPGLRREDWPRTNAYPGPVLRLPASWMEE